MSWDGFGIPGQVRRIIPGIGSLLGKEFNLKEEIERCHARLAESNEVLQILALPGWAKMCVEYQSLIDVQRETINSLNQNTARNVEEIQRRRDLQYACELWLQAIQATKIKHDDTASRLNHLERVVQNARPTA